MRSVFRQGSAKSRLRPPWGRTAPSTPGRRGLFAASALLAMLLLAPVLPAAAIPGSDTAAGQLHLSLTRMTQFSGRAVGAPARQMARRLPAEADALAELREPTATAETELGTALAELRQMSAPATLDPHYMPALVAAGRAYLALSGSDPVTRSTVNPEYLGVERELEEGVGRLGGLAKASGKLSERVRHLTRALLKTKRLAQLLERRALGAGASGRR